MYKWMIFATVITLVFTDCKSSKSDQIKPIQWVLTLTDESDASYINEKYANTDFICKERISKSGYRYLCEYSGPRSEAMDLQAQLIAETQVQDVSNYISKGSPQEVKAFKAKKAASSKK